MDARVQAFAFGGRRLVYVARRREGCLGDSPIHLSFSQAYEGQVPHGPFFGVAQNHSFFRLVASQKLLKVGGLVALYIL